MHLISVSFSLITSFFSIARFAICGAICSGSSPSIAQARSKRSSSGRQTCPSAPACNKVQSIPLRILQSESVCIPMRDAISSAIRKPIPVISSAILYGFSCIILYNFIPYCLQILSASVFEIPYFCKKIMASLASFFSSTCSAISLAFRLLIPLTSASRCGSSSIIRKVSSPK